MEFSKHLLSDYYVQDTVIGPGGRYKDKNEAAPVLIEFIFNSREKHVNNTKYMQDGYNTITGVGTLRTLIAFLEG